MTAGRRDPGLQPERTELAWQRTMISFVAAAMLLLRFTDHFGTVVVTMAVVAGVVAAYVVLRMRQRTRQLAATFPEAPVPVAVGEVLVLTAAALLLGALGLWLVLALTV